MIKLLTIMLGIFISSSLHSGECSCLTMKKNGSCGYSGINTEPADITVTGVSSCSGVSGCSGTTLRYSCHYSR